MQNTQEKDLDSKPTESVASSSLLSKDVIARLSIITSWRSSLAIAADWLMIFGAVILCEKYFSAPFYLLALLFLGSRYYGLTVMMHEAAHYRLFKNRKLNDWIGEALCALPSPAMTLHAYRNFHTKHHQHLNTTKDPEWEILKGNPYYDQPKTRLEICLDLIKAFIGVYSIDNGKRMSKSETLKSTPAKLKIARISFYLTLLVSSFVFGFFRELLIYWLVPMMTSFPFLFYIHTIAEHYRVEHDSVLTSTRHINANMLESIFFPHNVNYHLGHHLYPSVPYYNLPQLHAELLSKADYSGKAHISDGYLNVLFRERMIDAT